MLDGYFKHLLVCIHIITSFKFLYFLGHVGPEVELSKGCVIGSLCSVTCPELLPENTVIFGNDHQRRIQTEKPAPQGLQLDFLTKILPNYHHLIKPKKKQAV